MSIETETIVCCEMCSDEVNGKDIICRYCYNNLMDDYKYLQSELDDAKDTIKELERE